MDYLKLYNSLSKITIYSICLVICAGGTVRMTGSGMGCPDWPKCFGSWIPPTDVSDLPENYKEIYSERGYDKLDFDPFNTWIEYINRLLGVISGVFCFCLFVASLFVRHQKLILLSIFLLLLMAFQAWMGALVVYSVLSPFKITIHMLIALLILSLLFFLYHITSSRVNPEHNFNNVWILFGLTISIIQIILGTQVRENVDTLLESYSRIDIINQLPIVFEFHKTMALLVLLSNIMIIKYYWKSKNLYFEIKSLITTICLLFLTGLCMNYYLLLGPFQLLHLIGAVCLFVFQFSIFLKCSISTLKIP